MNKGVVPELREPYERLVRSVCGKQWRSLSQEELDGAIGVVIVKSILDGVAEDLGEVASHLGVSRDLLYDPFRNLSLNGVFREDRIDKDREALEDADPIAWGYYAGYASGATGTASERC